VLFLNFVRINFKELFALLNIVGIDLVEL